MALLKEITGNQTGKKFLKHANIFYMKIIRSKGFTLIELLVVISIIALLSSVVLSSLNSARSKSRDARRIQDVRQIKTAMELYKLDNGKYPGIITSGPDYNSSYPANVYKNVLAPYLKTFPNDPLFIGNNITGAGANDQYNYKMISQNQDSGGWITYYGQSEFYAMRVSLENPINNSLSCITGQLPDNKSPGPTLGWYASTIIRCPF